MQKLLLISKKNHFQSQLRNVPTNFALELQIHSSNTFYAVLFEIMNIT